MYNKCKRILEICPRKSLYQQKRLIATLILDFNSEEYALAHRAFRIEEDLSKMNEDNLEAKEKRAEFDTIADRYAEIYIGKLCVEKPFIEPIYLFYGKNMGEITAKLFRQYDGMLLNLICNGYDEINQWLRELKATIEEMDKKHILDSMRRKLPL